MSPSQQVFFFWSENGLGFLVSNLDKIWDGVFTYLIHSQCKFLYPRIQRLAPEKLSSQQESNTVVFQRTMLRGYFSPKTNMYPEKGAIVQKESSLPTTISQGHASFSGSRRCGRNPAKQKIPLPPWEKYPPPNSNQNPSAFWFLAGNFPLFSGMPWLKAMKWSSKKYWIFL